MTDGFEIKNPETADKIRAAMGETPVTSPNEAEKVKTEHAQDAKLPS